MKVYDVDQVVCFDCDDTLVMWPENDKFAPHNASHTQPYEGSVAFPDPYDGSTNYLTPHQKHINLMKKYRGRGFCIIVWSAGGVKWAHSVIKTLGLEEYVDIVLTKPNRYVDDLSCEKWMGNRVYIK